MKDTKRMKKGQNSLFPEMGGPFKTFMLFTVRALGLQGPDVLGISVRERGCRKCARQEP